MRKRTKVILFVGFALFGAGFFAFTKDVESLGREAGSKRQGEPLGTKMRTLWGDHIGFTRNYIISAIAGLKDKDAVATRLLENQDDIAAEFKPYYGLDYSKKLAQLLRAHISIATELVSAAKAGKGADVRRAQAKWAANGAEITAHFSIANPYWDKRQVAAMLKDHLELTTLEVEDRLAKDWDSDIRDYDKLHAHMLMFSDFLVSGLEQQFGRDPKGPATTMQELEASSREP